MRLRLLAPMLAFALAAAPAAAQQPDFSKAQINVERLAPGIAVLFGPGGNIGLSHGPDGNILIDDQYAPLTDKILAAVRGVDRGPIRFVVNTHWHGDHSGGNENLGKAGSVIVAHDNVRSRMAAGQSITQLGMTVPPAAAVALPVVTFGEGLRFHVNGQRIDIIHVAGAHTDGDALVHWPQARVLHMGDTFFNRVTLPFIDLSSGGSIDGLIAAARRGLALTGPGTKIIPGHGPVATRADLASYLAMLVDVRTRVAVAIRAKRSLAQIQAARPAARYGMADGFIKPEAFVAAVHASLLATPRRPLVRR